MKMNIKHVNICETQPPQCQEWNEYIYNYTCYIRGNNSNQYLSSHVKKQEEIYRTIHHRTPDYTFFPSAPGTQSQQKKKSVKHKSSYHLHYLKNKEKSIKQRAGTLTNMWQEWQIAKRGDPNYQYQKLNRRYHFCRPWRHQKDKKEMLPSYPIHTHLTI